MALKKSSNLNVIVRCYRDLRQITDNCSSLPIEVLHSLVSASCTLSSVILDAIVDNDSLFLTEY